MTSTMFLMSINIVMDVIEFIPIFAEVVVDFATGEDGKA